MKSLRPMQLLVAIAAAWTAAACAQPATAPAARPVAKMSAAECEVWNRERSFAASVEHHDAVAFAEHVHVHAAFGAGSTAPTHGRDAVVAGWKDIIDGKQFKLRWSPGIVTIGGDGSLAISRGPSWVESQSPDSAKHYRIGEFISTWIRDKDGHWRVLFDAGAGPMHEASADDVTKLVASLPTECPRTAQ